MVMVGAFARIEPGSAGTVIRRLERIAGVETFELDDPDKVGILIEADDMDRAHAMLTRDIRNIGGVWGVWPVYAHDDEDGLDGEQAGMENA
jgi:nitrate reductase NapAB chaperone NapD